MKLRAEDFKDEENLKKLINRVNIVIKRCNLLSKVIMSETVHFTNIPTKCMLASLADTFAECRDTLEGMEHRKKVTK